jgi:DNA polymerase-3 subunit gamma/tau
VYIIDEVHIALRSRFQRAAENSRRAAGPPDLHPGDDGNPQGAGDNFVPVSALTFKRILPAVIAERLRAVAASENLILTDDAARLLGALSAGSLGDGLSIRDQCATGDAIDESRVLSAIGLAGNDEIILILTAVADGDISLALEVLDKLYMAGKALTSVLESLTSLVRDLLVMSLMPGGGSVLLSGGFDPAALESLKARFTTPGLLSLMDILREALRDSFRSGGGRLGAEICLVRLCALAQEAAGERAPSASAPVRAAAHSVISGGRKAEKQPAPEPPPQKPDVPDAALQTGAPEARLPERQRARRRTLPATPGARFWNGYPKKSTTPGPRRF